MTDLERLHRVFGGEPMRWLVERARLRLERGEDITGIVTLQRPADAQRRAVEALLGRRPGSGTALSLALSDVDAVIRRSGIHSDGLRGVVETLTGPIVETAALREARQKDWDRAYTPLLEILAQWPDSKGFRALVQRLLKDPLDAAPVLAGLANVLSRLPVNGVPMARFAAVTAGHPHALDAGQPLATLADAAIAMTWPSVPAEAAGRAHRRRELWDHVGVLLDELSSTVLGINLTAMPGCLLYRVTEPARLLGEPVVLTLRQVGRERPEFRAGLVYVCENPAVVAAAADELGTACPPLVCVSGQPSTASMRLLEALHSSGSTLLYHGDFDWGGLRIANRLHARMPWQPWRYRTHDYEETVGRASAALSGRPVSAAWDDSLADSLIRNGLRVHEELVLDDLISDLRLDHSLYGL